MKVYFHIFMFFILKVLFKHMNKLTYFFCFAIVFNFVRSENDTCIIYSYLDNSATYSNQYFSLDLALESELMNLSSQKSIVLAINDQCYNLELYNHHYVLNNSANLTIMFFF